MLSPYKIRWHNMSSLDFDLWTEISFDGDNGDVETHLSREAIVSESYNGAIKRAHGYRWDDTLMFSVTFIKKNYEDFTEQENRNVLKWLTGMPNASFIDVYKDDSEVVEWSALGNWINGSQYKLANGRVVGYIAEFESLMPWALSPLKTITKSISSPSTFTISLDTDEPQSPVYPRITIKQNSNTLVAVDHALTDDDEWLDGTVYYYSGTKQYYWVDSKGVKHTSDTNTAGINTSSVVIQNTYIDENQNARVFSSKVKNNLRDEIIILDGANQVISSSNGRIFGDDFVNWSWLPLFEGTNTISVIGNCTITIEWREPIKCGEF